jgi:hypothetical protein
VSRKKLCRRYGGKTGDEEMQPREQYICNSLARSGEIPVQQENVMSTAVPNEHIDQKEVHESNGTSK